VQQGTRKIDVADSERVIERETARHDTNDGVVRVVELKGAPDHFRVAMKMPLPEAKIQHHDRLAAALRIAELNPASEKSGNSKETAGILGKVNGGDILRKFVAGDLQVDIPEAKQALD
jgi:hypothetical protein